MNRRTSITAAGALACALLAGCAGQTAQIPMKDGTGATKEVVFPKGRFFGGVSQEQVGTLAKLVSDSNTATAQRLDGIDRTAGETAAATGRLEEAARRLQEGGTRIEDSTRRIDETSLKGLDVGSKTYESTQALVKKVEGLSRSQGTGEITIFFPVASSRIAPGSLQYTRIVNFVDYLSRESRGRKLMLICVGSASAFGRPEINEKLAQERAEAPRAIVAQYLVNTPHEFVKVYGVGDAYSPKGVSRAEHGTYQSTRLIAYFEKGEEPVIPAPPAPAAERVSRR